jgi:hypothetical protein
MSDDTAERQTDVLLSRRDPPSAGWVAIDEFEDLLSLLGNINIFNPAPRRVLRHPFGIIQNRLLGPYHRLNEIHTGTELLLVIARTPSDLRMVKSIRDVGKNTRNIAGYVIDSYFTEGFESSVKEYDHIFCTTEEGAETVRKKFGVSSSILRQGFDCLNWASDDPARCIDLVGFGRQPSSYHREFQRAFHTHRSQLLYLHSPIGAIAGSAVRDERPMMLKLLQRSKISLAFHLLVEAQNDRPRAATFVTTRWLESLATGCVVVGKRPIGQMATEMLGWPNSSIELPDSPAEAVEAIKGIASDADFLGRTRAQNVSQMCRRHDWRYRIRDIYDHFHMEIPQRLKMELLELEGLVQRLKAAG